MRSPWKRGAVRPLPIEHRARVYRRMRTDASIQEIRAAFDSEHDKWLKKILAEALLQGATGASSLQYEEYVALNIQRGS